MDCILDMRNQEGTTKEKLEKLQNINPILFYNKI